MNGRQNLVVIVLRLMAIYFFCDGVISMAFQMPYSYSSGLPFEWGWAWAYGFVVGIYLLVSFILWKFATPLSKRVVPKSEVEQEGQTLMYENILSVGLVLMGLYFLVPGLVGLVSSTVTSVSLIIRGNDFELEGFLSSIHGSIAGNLLKVLIGGWFVVGNAKIVNWLIRFKRFDQHTVKTVKAQGDE